MAVAFRSASTDATPSGNSTTLSLAQPSGLQVGDYLIFNGTANLGATNTFSAPGFTRPALFTTASQSSNTLQDVLVRVVDGTESWPITFTNLSTAHLAGTLAAFSGVDPNNPIAGLAQLGSASGSNSLPAATPQTESAYGVLLFTMGQGTAQNTTPTAPSGYTTVANVSSGVTRWMQASIFASHTAYGLPLTSVSPGSPTMGNNGNNQKTTLFLRADISGTTTLTPDFVSFQSDASGTAHTFNLTTGYAGVVLISVTMSNSLPATVSSISGASLTWAQAVQSNVNNNTEIWWAYASSAISNQTITVNMSASSRVNLSVVSFKNAATSPIGATATGNAITQAVSTTAANSMVVYGMTLTSFSAVTAATSNTSVAASLFTTGTTGGAFGHSTAVIPSAGSFTAGLSAPTGKTYDTAVVEILGTVAGPASNMAFLEMFSP